LTKGDKVLIGSILALALIFFGMWYIQDKNASQAGIAIIRSGGKIVQEIELDTIESKVIPIEGPLGISKAKVEKDTIQMLSSPCKDKVCIKQGKISTSSQSIVCVPNEISITIEKKGEVDEITR
jgi:hypothetical protein